MTRSLLRLSLRAERKISRKDRRLASTFILRSCLIRIPRIVILLIRLLRVVSRVTSPWVTKVRTIRQNRQKRRYSITFRRNGRRRPLMKILMTLIRARIRQYRRRVLVAHIRIVRRRSRLTRCYIVLLVILDRSR